MPVPSKLLFLPGASGNILFWQPLANQLVHPATKVFVGYPGFGQTLPDSEVNGFDDLVENAVNEIDQPTALVAQSMGGVIAILAALKRPHLVTHLVLTATSAGLNTKDLGAKDWRVEFATSNPQYPDWFASYASDLTPDLNKIAAPVLLLWGDADPISPVAVGQRLFECLPNAELHVVGGGDHDLANVHARDLALLVDAHLKKTHA